MRKPPGEGKKAAGGGKTSGCCSGSSSETLLRPSRSRTCTGLASPVVWWLACDQIVLRPGCDGGGVMACMRPWGLIYLLTMLTKSADLYGDHINTGCKIKMQVRALLLRKLMHRCSRLSSLDVCPSPVYTVCLPLYLPLSNPTFCTILLSAPYLPLSNQASVSISASV